MEASFLQPSMRKNLAVSRVRKANILFDLDRQEEAAADLTRALASGALETPALHTERDDARLLLARIREIEFDHGAAAEIYRLVAETGTDGKTRAFGAAGLARAEMFTDGAAAIAHADRAYRYFITDATISKVVRADSLSIKGRAQLNAGQIKEARATFDEAIRVRGGLDMNIDLSEVAMRSDAAIAAIRAGDRERARKLLAWTGTGRDKGALPSPREMPLPACGGTAGWTPDDVAIVQFAIRKDGQVTGAQPVFASRQGDMAYAFAEAVNRWSWSAEDLAKIPVFYRVSARVEMRCSNQAMRPSVKEDFDAGLWGWLAQQGIPVQASQAGESYAACASRLRREMAASAAAAQPLAQAAYRAALAGNPSIGFAERNSLASDALATMRAHKAPARAWMPLAVLTIPQTKHGSSDGATLLRATALMAWLENPEVAADPVARAMLRLLAADDYSGIGRKTTERTALLAITQDAQLPDNHPFKVAALVMLANAETQRGDKTAAEAAYRRTGLSSRQCAALDAPPHRLTNGSDSHFPEEAQKWGFEGWTRQEFDIGANGRTVNVRTVVAFPPAVFAQASENLVSSLLYQKSFRPGGDLGCGGISETVNFVIAR